MLLVAECSILYWLFSLLSGVQPHINVLDEFWRPGSHERGSLFPVLVSRTCEHMNMQGSLVVAYLTDLKGRVYLEA